MKINLEAALAYAQRGWRVLPVVVNTKRPAIRSWPTAATTDASTLEQWFEKGNYSIGVATGEESNLLVIDVDRHRPSEDGPKEFERICQRVGAAPPKSVIARTPNGGLHIFYEYPRGFGPLPKQLGTGIDLLGEGRFALATPSAIDRKAYRWMQGRSPTEVNTADCNAWLQAALAPDSRTECHTYDSDLILPKAGTQQVSRADSGVNLNSTPSEDQENHKRLLEALSYIPSSISYPEWRNVLFSIKAHGLEGGKHIARRWSQACSEKYDESVFNKTWDSDRMQGINSGTVYWLASRYGWKLQNGTKVEAVEAVGDINNGREFASQMRGKLLHCRASNTWFRWNGQCWSQCVEGQHLECAKRVADNILDSAVAAFKALPNDGNTKARIQSAKALHGNERRLLAMLSMASTEDGMNVASPAAFDSDPWLIGVRNGVVDLRSGQLLPAEPSMLISKQCDTIFSGQASAPRFQHFLQEVFKGDEAVIAYVQRQLGYGLTGSVSEEVLFFWFGSGANGKSVLVNIVSEVVGNYAGHVSPDLLRVGREANADRATLRLAGLRMVLMNELAEGETWDDGRLREITSREKIAARYLYGEMFDFRPTHKLFVRGNNKPAIRDGTDGTWRRIHLVGFDRQFAEGERIADLDVSILDAERPGILNWLVEGCRRWQIQGLNPPESVRTAVREYRKDCDVIDEWMETCCNVGVDYSADKPATYQSYKCWTSENGSRPLSNKAFSRRIRERGFALDAGKRRYVGFRLAGQIAPASA